MIKAAKPKVHKLRVTGPDEMGSMYIYLKYPIKDGEVAKCVNAGPDVILDYDRNGKLLGIELLEVRSESL